MDQHVHLNEERVAHAMHELPLSPAWQALDASHELAVDKVCAGSLEAIHWRASLSKSAHHNPPTYTYMPHSPIAKPHNRCTQDCRSSFVTWLCSGNHSDETLRSAALAMHHSSKMQKSAAYDHEGSNRLVSSAVDVAAAYAASFATRM